MAAGLYDADAEAVDEVLAATARAADLDALDLDDFISVAHRKPKEPSTADLALMEL